MSFVSVILGSKSDYSTMQECTKILEAMGVNYEILISSAHRTHQRTKEYIKSAEKRGAKVFIAAAGMAAHLAGVIASLTTKPVIGVPMEGGALGGLDAILSTLQMPSGIPVATLALGKAGAVNSAYLSVQILSLNNDGLQEKLLEDRLSRANSVEADSKNIEKLL